MVAEVSLTGVEGFTQLSKALKHAGRGELRKELNKRLKEAVKPVIAETRSEARSRLPHRGGYGALVARAPQRIQVRTGDKTAGVRLIVVADKSSARRANLGIIRHPVFGDREVWVDQRLAIPGWFDVPANAAKPTAIKAAEDAMQSIVDDIAREAT